MFINKKSPNLRRVMPKIGQAVPKPKVQEQKPVKHIMANNEPVKGENTTEGSKKSAQQCKRRNGTNNNASETVTAPVVVNEEENTVKE